ncbi:MAG: aminotransferase class IV [Bacteroidales bacterium]|jgi:D-alanine transaminase|nr:aminotransferase class IV [Bacteroidales bacterium]MCB9027884.1 aminotransferase class IV [Bacteroidales bacterium]HPJ06367.1 aminotransferase class IV [Bacteroidales bacterium]HRW27998.1 aminotransferase class IV [Bacteroidales bacterium]
MEVVYLNGQFIPKDQAMISPDDRGFLFGDSIYEVTRWYGGYFFDLPAHAARFRRSLHETRIVWKDELKLEEITEELIHRNELGAECAIVYFQATRGVAPRNHAFPNPEVEPTVYGFARRHSINTLVCEQGAGLWLTPDPRWNRCDIKSTALIANVLPYQESHDRGYAEVCFVRNGIVTEGAHSNIFFVRDGTLYTHPATNDILAGITRKNVISAARDNAIEVVEEAVAADMIPYMQEAFYCSTTSEIVPATRISDQVIGEGTPGPVTRRLQTLLRELIQSGDPRRQ